MSLKVWYVAATDEPPLPVCPPAVLPPELVPPEPVWPPLLWPPDPVMPPEAAPPEAVPPEAVWPPELGFPPDAAPPDAAPPEEDPPLPFGVVLSLLQAAKENRVATVAAAAKLTCRSFILLTMKAVTVLGSYSFELARFKREFAQFPVRAQHSRVAGEPRGVSRPTRQDHVRDGALSRRPALRCEVVTQGSTSGLAWRGAVARRGKRLASAMPAAHASRPHRCEIDRRVRNEVIAVCTRDVVLFSGFVTRSSHASLWR